MEDKIKNKLTEELQNKKELKNTINFEGTEDYNINAVTAEVAKHTMADLTFTSSQTTSEESISFDGNVDKTIYYVPSTGGKFTGPVWIHEDDTSIKDINANEIINKGQIDTVIKNLDGAPLYTWNTDNDYSPVRNDREEDFKLNTVIGSIEDLPIFEAYSEGKAHSLHVTPDSYDNAYIRYGQTWYDAYWNEAYDDVKNTITKLVFKGSMESEQGDTKEIKIRGSSFYNMRGLISVHINEGVYELGTGAFSGCASLKSISIPESVTTIGKEAFQGCEALTGIVLGSKVTEIKTATFKGCKNLKSIVVCNKDITSIASDAFSGCEKLTKIYFKGTETEWNAISNNPIKSSTKIKVIPVDGTAFPFLYICKEADILDTSLTSNKMFLKLPNKDLVEISKGAARLERRDSKTSGNVDYFTYDVLAAVIAGINSRITALGSTALALPEKLTVHDEDGNTVVLDVPVNVTPAEDDKSIVVKEIAAPTVFELQEQITKITSGSYTDKIVPESFSDAHTLKYDFSGKTLKFSNIKAGVAVKVDTSVDYKITFSSETTIKGTMSVSSEGTTEDTLIISNSGSLKLESESESISSEELPKSLELANDIGIITGLAIKRTTDADYVSVSADKFDEYACINFEIEDDTEIKDYIDTVLKAKADEDGNEIKSSYYQTEKSGVGGARMNTGNSIRIKNFIPSANDGDDNYLEGIEGDICIVIAE